jgi:hypothetical protein
MLAPEEQGEFLVSLLSSTGVPRGDVTTSSTFSSTLIKQLETLKLLVKLFTDT